MFFELLSFLVKFEQNEVNNFTENYFFNYQKMSEFQPKMTKVQFFVQIQKLWEKPEILRVLTSNLDKN